mmetsp:Transcript_7341/g.22387  ORF Transcript_7341/g.22387 Transcript_7341/m.22387 type:complete len:335 (+) Transcript_7341:660-1664(+)
MDDVLGQDGCAQLKQQPIPGARKLQGGVEPRAAGHHLSDVDAVHDADHHGGDHSDADLYSDGDHADRHFDGHHRDADGDNGGDDSACKHIAFDNRRLAPKYDHCHHRPGEPHDPGRHNQGGSSHYQCTSAVNCSNHRRARQHDHACQACRLGHDHTGSHNAANHECVCIHASTPQHDPGGCSHDPGILSTPDSCSDHRCWQQHDSAVKVHRRDHRRAGSLGGHRHRGQRVHFRSPGGQAQAVRCRCGRGLSTPRAHCSTRRTCAIPGCALPGSVPRGGTGAGFIPSAKKGVHSCPGRHRQRRRHGTSTHEQGSGSAALAPGWACLIQPPELACF